MLFIPHKRAKDIKLYTRSTFRQGGPLFSAKSGPGGHFSSRPLLRDRPFHYKYIVIPFLPERLKLYYTSKTDCVKFTEIASHVLFLLLAIFYSVFHMHYYNLVLPNYAIYIIMGVIVMVFILACSFLVLAFIFLMRFFKYHNNKKKGLKYMMIKLLLYSSHLSLLLYWFISIQF